MAYGIEQSQKLSKQDRKHLTSPLILIYHLQPLHIMMKSWIKTLTPQVKTINCRETL